MINKNGKAIMAESTWKQILVNTILKRSGGVQGNSNRDSYAPWLKEIICEMLQTSGASFQEMSELTGIPIRTLENFKEFSDKVKLEKKTNF